MGLAETAELAVRITLKDNVSGGIRKLQGNLGGLNRSLAQTGRGVGQIGTGIARAGLLVGGAAIAGIVAAGKAAIDFQEAFAGVRKTVNEADLTKVGLSFDKLALSFRKMATEMPIAATDLARIGEAAGALGIHAQDIETFTKTVALLGVTTNLTTDVAAEDLGKLGTILGLTGRDFTDLADTLVNLGNQGASTESEIIEVTKRFAAMGKQAGLTNNQILALASTATSLGAEPEAAGSALSRIFSNMATNIALGDKKGTALAQVTSGLFDDISKLAKAGGDAGFVNVFGKQTESELDRLQKAVNSGGSLDVLKTFLLELGKLDRLDAAKALKAAGITNVRDRNAILLMAQNLGEVNRQLAVADKSTGALSVEAQKRFDTIASKLTVLANNFKEAGIVIGEGFLPALGRATEKLTAFLQVDANKARLKAIGEDIGRAIDGINWEDVLSGASRFVDLLKGALSFAKLLFDAFMALPGPIKEATAGFLVLNKLSGNLLAVGAGNVIGGLAGAAGVGLASRAPGVGRLFAQPVFVTNFPPGFGAGGALGAGAAATSIWSKIGRVIGGAFLIATAAELADVIHSAVSPGGGLEGRTRGQGGGLLAGDKLMWPFGPKNTPRIDLGPFKNVLGGDSAFTSGEMLGPPTPRGWENLGSQRLGPPAPGQGSFGIGDLALLMSRNSIADITARGKAAGFSPTAAAIAATAQRNAERWAAAQKAATERTTTAVNNVRAAINGLPTGLGNTVGPGGSPRHSGFAPKPTKGGSTVNPATGFTVKVSSSIKDTANATVIRGRFGKTSAQAGAE